MAAFKEGDKGPNIKALQQKLNQAGGRLKIQTPAVFDTATRDCIVALQKSFGTPVNGVATEHFQTALDIKIKKTPTTYSAPEYEKLIADSTKSTKATDTKLETFRKGWPKKYDEHLKRYADELAKKVHPLAAAVEAMRKPNFDSWDKFERLAMEIRTNQKQLPALRDIVMKAKLAALIDTKDKECQKLLATAQASLVKLDKAVTDNEAKVNAILKL